MASVLDQPAVRALVESLLADDPEHALLLLDPQGRIVAWLGAAERLFGYSAEQMVGREVVDIFMPQDRAQRQDEVELEAARRTGRAEDDRWHLRGDGAAVWVTGTMIALHDPAGALIGFAKLLRDRTDLRIHVETLETRVAGMARKLDAATLMLRTLGHELRNPLAPMLNVAVLLERASASSGAAGAGTAVSARILRRQIEVMQRLADDLMDFSRADSGQLQLRYSTFPLQGLLREIADAMAPAAAERGMQIELLVPDVPIELSADRQRLQQVIVNLVDNALKYNGPGHRVVMRATEEPPDAVIRVEDDGVGIPADLLPHLFELFARGGAGSTGREGLGIGLAMAKNLVELHGGSIEARSAGVGKGSVFGVRLPTRPRGASLSAAADGAPATRG